VTREYVSRWLRYVALLDPAKVGLGVTVFVTVMLSEHSDDALRAKTDEFRARLKAGATTAQILPEAFAVVREAAVRGNGVRKLAPRAPWFPCRAITKMRASSRG